MYLHSVTNRLKKLILLAFWKPLTKRAGSGSVSQCTVPRIRTPSKNISDPKHWFVLTYQVPDVRDLRREYGSLPRTQSCWRTSSATCSRSKDDPPGQTGSDQILACDSRNGVFLYFSLYCQCLVSLSPPPLSLSFTDSLALYLSSVNSVPNLNSLRTSRLFYFNNLQCCGSVSGFFHPAGTGSRILIRNKEYFNTKHWYKALGNMIRDDYSG